MIGQLGINARPLPLPQQTGCATAYGELAESDLAEKAMWWSKKALAEFVSQSY